MLGLDHSPSVSFQVITMALIFSYLASGAASKFSVCIVVVGVLDVAMAVNWNAKPSRIVDSWMSSSNSI